jgi:hypothetical protein
VNPDVSVAPEIAQLMEPPLAKRAVAAGTGLTVGDLARQLKLMTGAPERWWHLVRFDPARPLVVDIPVDGPYRAWLTILPPATEATPATTAAPVTATAPADTAERPCDVVTVVAGELTEAGPGADPAPLTPGKVRVHGGGRTRRAVNTGDGYTVSVHLRGHPGHPGHLGHPAT